MKPNVLSPHELAIRASDVEESFVGALIVAAEWASEECPSLWGVEVEDFHNERWATVFAAIKELFERGKRPHYVNLCHQLEDMGKLEFVGGASEITRLLQDHVSFVTLPDLADSILEMSERRAILTASGKVAQAALQPGDAGQAVEEARRILGEAQQRRLAQLDTAILYHEDTQEFAYREMTARHELTTQAADTHLDTPWADVNRFIGCFRPGHLFILAGYPAHGKSVVFEQIAEHNAQRGFQVAFLHLEHTNWWMTARRTMRLTGAHVYQQERGRCMEETLEAAQRVQEWHGAEHFVHCPGWTASQIARQIRELYEAGRCDLAIVDYLQKIILVDKRGWNKAAQIGEAVETLKVVGEELKIPILLGSQLSRAGHMRPHLNHLRGSGELEEKANYVLFIWRERLTDETLSNTAELYQEKPFGIATDLYFDREHLAFMTLAEKKGREHVERFHGDDL